MMLSSWKICCARVSQRWVFAVMGCLAIANAYTMRVCLSIAITEMVKPFESSSNSTSTDQTCPSSDSSSSTTTNGGIYEWDEYTQGIILSSFYWGYVITQLPGGVLADKFGGKYTLGLGMLSTAILTLVTPIVVETYDSLGLIILRVLMGFFEGVTYPALGVLIAKWAPPLERSKIGGVVMSGAAVGTVLGNGLSGVLIQYSSIGWPIVFYFFGALGCLWSLAWFIFCYSRPESHPFISEKERSYLHETTKEHTHKQIQPIPWRHVVTSVPVWAMVLGKVGFAWGFFVLLTDLPKYMSSVLKFSIDTNGFLTALPFIIKFSLSIIFSWLGDWLIKSEKLSTTNLRKTYFTIAMVVPAVLIIAASYAGCDRVVVVILFTAGVGMMSPIYASIMMSPNDLSPNYSGTLMAIVNATGSICGILAPYAVGIITPNQTLSEWRIVFWISFAISLFSAVVFAIWADGEVQYWNDLDPTVDGENEVEGKKQHGEDNSSSFSNRPYKL